MDFILTIFAIFVGGGYFIGKLVGNTITSDSDDFLTSYREPKESPTVINNYTTNIQQNLHITEEQLERLKNNLNS